MDKPKAPLFTAELSLRSMEHCAMIAGKSITTNFVPIVATTEVERFFRELRQTVVNLENAYRKEVLSVYLPRVDVESQFGTALFNVYWRLIRRPFIKDPQVRRIETVFALLEQVRDQLLETDTSLRQWEADGVTFQRRSDGRLIARSNSTSNPHRYRA